MPRLPVGARPDAPGLFLALGADLGGFLLALRLHAAIDRLGVGLRQVGAADAHVDHVDAEVLGLGVHQFGDLAHQFVTFVAHHGEEGLLAKHAAKCRVEDRGEPLLGRVDVADRLVEFQRVRDPVASEGIDHETLLVGGDDLLHGRIEVEDAVVEIHHVVRDRHLPVQAGPLDDVPRVAEAEHERLLRLVHGEGGAVDGVKRDGDEKEEADTDRSHWLAPMPVFVPLLELPLAPLELRA